MSDSILFMTFTEQHAAVIHLNHDLYIHVTGTVSAELSLSDTLLNLCVDFKFSESPYFQVARFLYPKKLSIVLVLAGH